ncbi:histone-lysine N-methyltransferase SETMAR [Trichonephila clavipes]|nr:histone-lysine N-methyltransferase SETMAR [Trichonephila clavipes]
MVADELQISRESERSPCPSMHNKVHGFCVHDNARPHTANIVKQFLTKKELVQIEHPPYSPDPNLPDFFLFPRLKLVLKGKRIDDIPDIQQKVTRHLNCIPKEDFLQSFQGIYSRSQWFTVMEGDYFEGQ